MTKDEWRRAVTRHTKAVGTYQAPFKPIIETLATILEKRDAAYAELEAEGGEAVTEHIGDRGSRNLKKNPRLQVWQDLNTQALAYWRDLGLTPAGLKKIKDTSAAKNEGTSSLERALHDISKELGSGP